MRQSLSRSVTFSFLLWLLCGCGSEKEDLAAVSGKIYYQESLVRSGVIVFTPNPQRGGTGPIAIGNIRTDGTYVLSTDQRKGAVPGWHHVTIFSPLSASSDEVSIPRRYSDPDHSGELRKVQIGQPNTFDFHLK